VVIEKMIGEFRTPSFSQICKRIGRLGVDTDQDEMTTLSDQKRLRILAADATWFKRHNSGE
jgi:hypothetical protein